MEEVLLLYGLPFLINDFIIVRCHVHLLCKVFVLECGSSDICWIDLDLGNCYFILRQGTDWYYFLCNSVNRLYWIVSAGDTFASGESGVSGV